MTDIIVAALALLVLSISTAWSKDLCSYKNTNELAWDSQFQHALHRFFGELRDEHFSDGQLVAEQALARLGGPPDDLQGLGEGLVLAAACKAHSCPEHGAVVIDCPSTILAVAIVRYYQQCRVRSPVDLCEQLPTVTLFFRDPKAMVGRGALEKWIDRLYLAWGNGPPPPVIVEYRAADGARIRPPYVVAGHAPAH